MVNAAQLLRAIYAFGGFACRISALPIIPLAILAGALLGTTDNALAQTAVCSNTPAADERVECTEDSTSSDNIDILLEGVDIDVDDATEVNTHAVSAKHEGSGNIDINITSSVDEANQTVRSTIDTSGAAQAYGVLGQHTGTGTVDISVSTTTIGTMGSSAHGVHGYHTGSGRIVLDVSDSRIDTKGTGSHGIYADHVSTDTSPGTDPRVSVTATSNEIVTEGQEAHGIRGALEGPGNVTVTSTSNTVTTKGFSAHGIYGYHRGEGDINIVSQDDTITTEASSTYDGAMGTRARPSAASTASRCASARLPATHRSSSARASRRCSPWLPPCRKSGPRQRSRQGASAHSRLRPASRGW